MKLLLLSLLSACLLGALSSLRAELSDLNYSVFDTLRDEEAHVCRDIYFRFYPHDNSGSYWTLIHVMGINREEFSVVEESGSFSFSEDESQRIEKMLMNLPTEGLNVKPENSERTFGWLQIDDAEPIYILARPDTPARQQWDAAIESILTTHLPLESRERKQRILEGDIVQPVEIDFPTLLANPEKYDGKRIRLSGYYHSEFEGSSFAATPKSIDDGKHAVWLGGPSSFADEDAIKMTNDSWLTVDGTYQHGRGGHMGFWMGELHALPVSCPLSPLQGKRGLS